MSFLDKVRLGVKEGINKVKETLAGPGDAESAHLVAMTEACTSESLMCVPRRDALLTPAGSPRRARAAHSRVANALSSCLAARLCHALCRCTDWALVQELCDAVNRGNVGCAARAAAVGAIERCVYIFLVDPARSAGGFARSRLSPALRRPPTCAYIPTLPPPPPSDLHLNHSAASDQVLFPHHARS